MRIAKLYVITNLVNSKQYYGWAFCCKRRWIEHRCGHGSKLVYQAIKKYGLENFKFEILCSGEFSYIKELEQITIKDKCSKAPNGYNLSGGGEGTIGICPSKETRQKMSVAHTGDRNGMHGKKHSKETKQNMREKALKRDSSTRKIVRLPGASNPRAIPVIVNGIEYSYIGDAAKAIGIKPQTLRARFRRYSQQNKFPENWGYLNS